MLFENPGPVMAVHGRKKVEDAIRQYEPRIDKLDVYYNVLGNSGTLVLNIRFTIVNQKAVYETNIKLERTR
jgi:predicted component of type VI protein secretion system